MAIGAVKQEGDTLRIYDEKGCYKAFIGTTGGQLVGYTANTVSIKFGGITKIYDEKGNYQSSC